MLQGMRARVRGIRTAIPLTEAFFFFLKLEYNIAPLNFTRKIMFNIELCTQPNYQSSVSLEGGVIFRQQSLKLFLPCILSQELLEDLLY